MKHSHAAIGTFLVAGLAGLMFVMQAGSKTSDRVYTDDAGIKFTYPEDWKAQRRPDKDTIIKIDKENAGEFTLSEMDNGLHLPMPAFIAFLDTMFFSKLKDFKEVKREAVVIGRDNNIHGTWRQIKFTYETFSITQHQVFVPVKGNKIYCLNFIEPLFKTANPTETYSVILKSFELPTKMLPPSPAVADKTMVLADTLQCTSNDVCPMVVTKRPNPEWTLEQKLQAVLPRAEEERWLEVPWESNIMAARLLAYQQKKPLFVWIMDGNVLGAT